MSWASQSAARRTSSRCAGSALTDGIAMNSRSSSTQACSTAGHFTELRRLVAELGSVCERTQLLQRLVLDLADPLARHVERPADLVERPRSLAVQAKAHLDHAALALAEHLQRAAERLVPQRQRSPLVGQRLRVVLDEVAELRLLV